MGPAHLGDRVVPVADEDTLVELRRPLALDAVEWPPALGDVGRELVEEQPSERPAVARVARKQGALHRLRQVDEAEDGPVEVGEMAVEERSLLGREFLDRVAHGEAS